VTVYEAPAKLNLSLHVAPPVDGRHPLESIVQTIDWLDHLEVESVEEWSFSVHGADLDPDDNLVTRALRRTGVERARVHVTKEIPMEAGLGGGSSNAAAALLAAVDLGYLEPAGMPALAAELGSDVPMFLEGGTQLLQGTGDVLEALPAIEDVYYAVVVPDFGMSTAAVYQRWDELEGPEGDVIPDGLLPPVLRDGMPIRNDLLPAAVSVEPLLGDFMSDTRELWGGPVLLTGSGSACFGFFSTLDEATDAATTVPATRAARGVTARRNGVLRRT
jgi:4-diphosphocytidyl-2-C-methyl-D-erythritol kinase